MRRMNFQTLLNPKVSNIIIQFDVKQISTWRMCLFMPHMWIFIRYAESKQKYQLQLFAMYAGVGRQSCKVFEEVDWWRDILYCPVSHQLLKPCTGSCSWECKAFWWDWVWEGSSQKVCEEGRGVWLYARCCAWTSPWTYSSKQCPTR